MNFAQFLEVSALKYPDKTALVVGKRRLTYGEMDRRARHLAGALHGMGYRAGDRVAIAACNCLEYPEIVYACARLGLVSVMLNWRLTTTELVRLIERNDPKLLFLALGHPAREQELTAALDGRLPVYRLGASEGKGTYRALLEEHPCPPLLRVPEDHILMHIHTSGTTGLPKPVLYTHGSFSKQVLTYLYHTGVDAKTIYQQITQMFHAACVAMFGCLAIGATVIALDHFDINEYLATIQREHTTRLGLIPSILRQIVSCPELDRYDVSSVRDIAYSTAPMPPSLIQQAMKVLPCRYHTSYGMTEMGPIVTAMGPEEHQQERLLSSVGRPIVGCDVRILSPEGRECMPHESGEIYTRGFGMMKGYLDMKSETEWVLQDGWFRTGDIGCLDEDGYLYLKGRKDNMIITGGENVYPTEIQNIIQATCGEVSEAVVYGVPDDRWGEAVVASIILAPGQTITEEEVRARCRKHLAGYCIPKKFFIETSLPRNQVGKVQIKELIKRHSQMGDSSPVTGVGETV